MSEHVQVMRGGEVVLRSPEAVRLVAHLCQVGVRVAAGRDRIAPSSLVRHLLGAFEMSVATTAAPAVAAVPKPEPLSASSVDMVGTKEIAEMLGTKERNARDRCVRGSFLTAVKVGGCWYADPAEVERVAGGDVA